MILAGLSVFIGHNYSIWLNFKGGKGIATYLGIIFSTSLTLGFLFIIIWLITSIIFRTSSISSLLTIFLIPFISIFLIETKLVSILFFVLTIISFYRHSANIRRILDGNEPKIKIKWFINKKISWIMMLILTNWINKVWFFLILEFYKCTLLLLNHQLKQKQ